MANAAVLDFETTPTFTLTVSASDGVLSDTAIITVNLTNLNDNAPAFGQASYTFGYDENQAAGSVLGTVSATDADGSTPSFSITAGDPNGWFQINTAGEISLTTAGAASLANDFEALANTRNLTVSATDGSNSTNVSVSLNEQNLNDNAPAFGQASYTFGYDENQAAGSVLGTVSATDADGSTPSFSITAGDPNGWFQINTAGEISLTTAGAASLANDFEALANTRNLTVSATDGSNSTDVSVSLNEQNLNDNAPAFGQASYTFGYDENQAAGSVLGTVSATDADGSTPSFSITAGDPNGWFQINTAGEISLTTAGAASLANDFEALANSRNLTVSATDGSNSTNVSVSLNEQNLNDNAPAFGQASYTFGYDENQAAGSVLGTVSATDADGSTPSFSITAGDPNGWFQINTAGEISLTTAGAASLANDFEALANTRNLTVSATDGSNSTDVSVSLNEQNLNDNAPAFGQASYTFGYDENQAAGSVLGTVSATDADGSTPSFSITAGDPNGWFQINTAGEISLTTAGAASLANDFEALANSRNLTVSATDGSNSTNVSVSLNEQNLNDNAPAFGQASYTFGYDENQAAGSVLGTVSATDADGSTPSFSITAGDPNGWFQINTAGEISLTTAGAASLANDFEALANTRNLTVSATDGSNSTNVSVSLNEQNLNDNAPAFGQASYTFGYDENQAAGSVLGTVSATDADGSTPSFSITAGDPNGWFQINTAGEISLTTAGAASLANDFEALANTRNLTVSATDGSNSTNVSVSLNEQNLNDNAPAFGQASYTFGYDENQAAGSVLGTVSATDADGSTPSFSITAGDPNGWFQINTAGEISLTTAGAASLANDFEALANTRNLTVSATDGSNSTNVSVSLNEQNLNDNAPAFGQASYTFGYDENQAAGSVLGTVSATDADGSTPSFSITAGDPNGWFQINTAGEISLTTAGAASLANDFEALANTRNLTVSATDGSNSTNVSVSLNEQNLNDNAPAFGQASYTFGYDENQAAGSVLGTVSATDADGSTPSFSITAGDPNGWFQINTAGEISLTTAGAASLANDFEALANTRNLTVSATDGSNSTDVSVSLNEQNLNDNAPAFGQASYTFGYDENQAAGSVLGTVSATDADGSTPSFSITAGDPNGWFQINTAGEISLTTAGAASLANDFEALANTRNLTVSATDGSNSTNVSVSLNEQNLNDNAPAFGQASYTFGYDENQAAGSVLGTVSATDADGSTPSFSITAGDPNGWFQINTAGEISLTTAGAASLANDFEALANTRNLTVSATDGSNSTNVSVSLNEQNLNDNAPAFGQASYTFGYDENQAAGSVLGTVSATDADGSTPSFSITAGDPNGWFQINTAGEISLTTAGAASLANDFEALANTRNLTVSATDGSNSTNVSVSLNEQNLNDNAPAFGQASYTFGYDENQAAGSVLGTVSATDADGSTPSFSITAGDPNGWFQINTAGEISLTTAGAASLANDFEALANTRNLTVSATDGSNSTNVSVSLNEQNLNDNAPAFGQASYTFGYDENQAAGAVLGTVSATDADGSTPSFSITAGDPNGWFQINTAGEISLTTAGAASLANDFEALANTRNLTVSATDGSNSTNVSVSLNEQNLNDNAPAFGQASYTFGYDENQAAGAVLGTVSATDADGSTPSFSITAGDPNGWFQINTAGEISLTTAGAASLANDFEALANTRNLTVSATDGSNSTNVSVSLNEQNLNDNAPAFGQASYTFGYDENQAAGSVLGTVSATDADGSTPSFSITAGDPNGWFQINAAGEISLTTAGAASLANDFEALANTRNLTVSATDGSNSTNVSVSLNEQNLNDNAPAFGQASYTFGYDENQAAGSVLGTVSATDADGSTPSFSITAGDPNGWFQINAAGEISLTTPVRASLANDFEALANTRNLTVTATDGSNSTDVSVALTEQQPQRQRARPSAPAAYSFTYDENQAAGAVLGTVSASDLDGDTPSFSITAGDPNGWFQINAAGEISFTALVPTSLANDFEALANTRNLTVTATDGSNSTHVSVALTEPNVNDNAPGLRPGSLQLHL